MKEYNATLIDYGEGKGKLIVESQFGKVTFAVKADSHMWVELERPHGEWVAERLDKYKKYKITCPFCKMEYVDNYDGYIDAIDFNFCPNCGASMRVKDELNRVNNELNSEPKDSHAEYWNSIGDWKEGEAE